MNGCCLAVDEKKTVMPNRIYVVYIHGRRSISIRTNYRINSTRIHFKSPKCRTTAFQSLNLRRAV